jgi:hypothetical protein
MRCKVTGNFVRKETSQKRIKKPPVFIGGGRCSNRMMNHTFRDLTPFGFSKDWKSTKLFIGLDFSIL